MRKRATRAVGAAHLDQVVAIAKDNALASAGERLGDDKLLTLFDDVDGAGVLVADAGKHVLVSVQGKLFVNLIASMELVVKVSGFGQQRLHTNHLSIAA